MLTLRLPRRSMVTLRRLSNGSPREKCCALWRIGWAQRRPGRSMRPTLIRAAAHRPRALRRRRAVRKPSAFTSARSGTRSGWRWWGAGCDPADWRARARPVQLSGSRQRQGHARRRARLPFARPRRAAHRRLRGPHLGARLSTKNTRTFSQEQLAEARAMPTKSSAISTRRLGPPP